MDNKQPHIEHVRWPSVENGGLVPDGSDGSYVSQHWLATYQARASGRSHADPSELSDYAGAWTPEIAAAGQCLVNTQQSIIPLGAIAAALEVTAARLHELYVSAPCDVTEDTKSFFAVYDFKPTSDAQGWHFASHGESLVFVDFHEWEDFIFWAQGREGTQGNAVALLRKAMFPND